jgi:succinyl-diaminopimelate desuccinylase
VTLGVDALAQALVARTQMLCDVPSVTGAEGPLADRLWAWAGELPAGLPRARYGNSMVLGAPRPETPTVALVGHIDTVPPAELPMAASHVDGERLVGLGASDMKGGVAVMQLLYEALATAPNLAAVPMLVLYDREEGPYADNGLEPLLQAHTALKDVDLAVAMEPTDNTLQLGCVGSLQATVRFAGRAAHSARPWQGDNAIHKAGPLLSALGRQGAQDVVVHGLTFREATSVTMARGGRAKNVVPDAFELNINHRFAPADGSLEAAIAHLQRLAQDATLVIDDAAPAGPVPLDNPLVRHFAALCDLELQPKQAWTDVARLAAHGIDAINFGPGRTDQAHQRGEYIEVPALVRSYEALMRLLTAPI